MSKTDILYGVVMAGIGAGAMWAVGTSSGWKKKNKVIITVLGAAAGAYLGGSGFIEEKISMLGSK